MQKCWNIINWFRYCYKRCSKNIPKSNTKGISHTNNPKKLVTWNLQALFYFLFPNKLENIIQELKTLETDLLCLQEVFEPKYKKNIIQELNQIYPYYLCGNLKRKYCICEDSGLLILSKYDIQFVKEVFLPNLTSCDNFSKRTILYFTIGEINFAMSHLQSNNEDGAEKHLDYLLDECPFEEFIIIGDLNHNNADGIVGVKKNNNINTWDNEILDYILPVNMDNYKFDVKTYLNDITFVTDHQPVFAELTEK